MKTLRRILLIIPFLFPLSCSDDDIGGHQCGTNENDRIGAKCNDGSTSTATGSGACSSHGGVKYWICKWLGNQFLK